MGTELNPYEAPTESDTPARLPVQFERSYASLPFRVLAGLIAMFVLWSAFQDVQELFTVRVRRQIVFGIAYSLLGGACMLWISIMGYLPFRRRFGTRPDSTNQ